VVAIYFHPSRYPAQVGMNDSRENSRFHVILEESRVIGTTKDLRVAGSYFTVDLPRPEILRCGSSEWNIGVRCVGQHDSIASLFSSFEVSGATGHERPPKI